MTEKGETLAGAIGRGRRNNETALTLQGMGKAHARRTVRPFAATIAAEIFHELLTWREVEENERQHFYTIAVDL